MAMAASALEDLKGKYKSKRLREAHLFLSSISFDGSINIGNYDLPSEDQTYITSQDEYLVVNDPPLARLISNASSSEHSKRPNLIQSISVTASVNVEDELRHKKVGGIPEPPDNHGMVRSKSSMETAKEYVNNVLHVWNPNRWEFNQKPIRGKRIVFVSQHQVPYQSFSVIPYTKMYNMVTANERHNTVPNSTSNTGTFIDMIDMGDGRTEVSYSHLLVPESWKHRKSEAQDELDAPNVADGQIVDDPELTSGKHRTVLNLPSFMLSIIQYAKPSEVKKDINERFKEKFPQVTITLTKLRSLKAELQEIATKLSLDAAVLACAFVYFEKVILKTRITKYNRKCIAGSCLLLSIKYFDDVQSKNVKACIEEITDQFRLSTKDLLSCELQVLILLEFALVTSIQEVFPIYKRLETSIL